MISQTDFNRKSAFDDSFELSNSQPHSLLNFKLLENKLDSSHKILKFESVGLSLENWMQSLKLAKQRELLIHQNLLKMLDFSSKAVQTNDNSQTSYFVSVFFEAPLPTLAQEIERRKNTRMHFSGATLTDIYTDLIRVLSFLQSNHFYHGDIRPDCIVLNGDSQTGNKLIDSCLETTKPGKRLLQHAKNGHSFYASPNLYAGITNLNAKVRHSPFKSDVFALGLVILEAGLLKSVQSIYAKGDINIVLFLELLDEFVDRYVGYPILTDGLFWILEIDEKTRKDSAKINKRLLQLINQPINSSPLKTTNNRFPNNNNNMVSQPKNPSPVFQENGIEHFPNSINNNQQTRQLQFHVGSFENHSSASIRDPLAIPLDKQITETFARKTDKNLSSVSHPSSARQPILLEQIQHENSNSFSKFHGNQNSQQSYLHANLGLLSYQPTPDLNVSQKSVGQFHVSSNLKTTSINSSFPSNPQTLNFGVSEIHKPKLSYDSRTNLDWNNPINNLGNVQFIDNSLPTNNSQPLQTRLLSEILTGPTTDSHQQPRLSNQTRDPLNFQNRTTSIQISHPIPASQYPSSQNPRPVSQTKPNNLPIPVTNFQAQQPSYISSQTFLSTTQPGLVYSHNQPTSFEPKRITLSMAVDNSYIANITRIPDTVISTNRDRNRQPSSEFVSQFKNEIKHKTVVGKSIRNSVTGLEHSLSFNTFGSTPNQMCDGRSFGIGNTQPSDPLAQKIPAFVSTATDGTPGRDLVQVGRQLQTDPRIFRNNDFPINSGPVRSVLNQPGSISNPALTYKVYENSNVQSRNNNPIYRY